MSDTEIDSESDREIIDDEKAFEELEKKFNHKIVNNKIIDEIIIVKPEDRITSDKMSFAEYTEVISIRAKSIERGGPIYIDTNNETNSIKLAENELLAKKCPLFIIRQYNDGKKAERWDVNELGLPF